MFSAHVYLKSGNIVIDIEDLTAIKSIGENDSDTFDGEKLADFAADPATVAYAFVGAKRTVSLMSAEILYIEVEHG